MRGVKSAGCTLTLIMGLMSFREDKNMHRTYGGIVQTIRAGTLIEPFTRRDWQAACPAVPDGTCNAFLNKHRRGNPGGNSELFERVASGQFKCLRPFKYGL